MAHEHSKQAIKDSESAQASAQNLAVSPSTPTRTKPATFVTPDEVYDKMKSVRQLPGELSDITPKGIATLVACLIAVNTLGVDEATWDIIRYRLKNESGGKRALNRMNPYLVAIHCCHEKTTKAQRTEFSRFSNVVKVAHCQHIQPDQAGHWLKTKTQAVILDEARRLNGKRPVNKSKVVISNKVRSHIWQAVQAGGGKRFALAIKRLDALEAELAAGA